jgi:hypothetical protein
MNSPQSDLSLMAGRAIAPEYLEAYAEQDATAGRLDHLLRLGAGLGALGKR